MPVGSFDGQYGGLGIATAVADSGDTTLPAPQVTATFGQMGGVQPPVARGKLFFSVANVTGMLGQVDFYATDGDNQEWVGTMAAPATGVANRGCGYVTEFFLPLSKVTNITSVVAQIGSGLTAGTARLRVLGSR